MNVIEYALLALAIAAGSIGVINLYNGHKEKDQKRSKTGWMLVGLGFFFGVVILSQFMAQYMVERNYERAANRITAEDCTAQNGELKVISRGIFNHKTQVVCLLEDGQLKGIKKSS